MPGVVGSILNNLFGRQYTIGELMNIDKARQGRASNCTPILVKIFHTLKQEGVLDKFKSFVTGKTTIKTYYITFKFEVKSDTGNMHYVYIQIDPDFSLKNWSGNRVKIYCDCADFKYRSAYILDKRSSLFVTSKIKMALGSAMTEVPTGKKGTTLLCKHSFAALTWLMNNYSNIMKTI